MTLDPGLMQEEDWNSIEYFSKNEKWGDWTIIDKRVIYKLDAMRKYAGKPFVVHCAYEKDGHTTTSQHYVGKAVDGHFVDIPLIEQYLVAERFGWHGIGVYPDWNNQGLHLDMRDIVNSTGARWGQKKIDGVNTYCEMDSDFIRYILLRQR